MNRIVHKPAGFGDPQLTHALLLTERELRIIRGLIGRGRASGETRQLFSDIEHIEKIPIKVHMAGSSISSHEWVFDVDG